MVKAALLLMALGVAGGAAVGQTCEAVQAAIEQKIRATGTLDFSLTAVPTESTAAGKLVGSCDRGAKKILYTRAASAAGASAASAGPLARPLRPDPGRAKPATPEPMLTECKDGSMSLGGDCKK